MSDLIREKDGSIRYCDSNIAKMGYWWVVKRTYTISYFVESISECVELIFLGLQAVLLLLILPVAPLIKSYFAYKQSQEKETFRADTK